MFAEVVAGLMSILLLELNETIFSRLDEEEGLGRISRGFFPLASTQGVEFELVDPEAGLAAKVASGVDVATDTAGVAESCMLFDEETGTKSDVRSI